MTVEATPRLWPAVIYGSIGVWGYSLLETGASGATRTFGHGLALLGLVLAAITTTVYVCMQLSLFVDALFRSASETAASCLARQLQGLTQEQVAIVSRFVAHPEEYSELRNSMAMNDLIRASLGPPGPSGTKEHSR